MRQLSFLPSSPREHGGEIQRGKRKLARPIDPKQAIHVVLRSTRARGAWSMLHPRNQKHVDRITRRIAARHGIRIYRYANVGNHLHLLVRTQSRRAFQSFLRELSGTIAQLITGAQRGRPLPGRFWDHLAFTRIVSWGREFRALERYLIKNLFEAAGLLTRKMRAAGVRVRSISRDPRNPPR